MQMPSSAGLHPKEHQKPLGSQAVMLSMLLRLFCRDNTIQPETRPRQKAFCKAGRRRWPWGRHRSVGKESSQAYTISEEEQRVKRLEKLKRDLERMSNERDELRGILAHYINKDLNKRFNFETMMLEMQHDQVMSELKNIPQQISEALYMCQELTKNNQLYSIRNCHLLTESLHMKNEVKMLWNENRQLLKEQITLDVCFKETRRLCVEASMKIYDKFSKHIQQFLEIFSFWYKPYDRRNIKFRMLYLQHEKTTMNMQKMTSRMCDAIENCKKLIEENYSYRRSALTRDIDKKPIAIPMPAENPAESNINGIYPALLDPNGSSSFHIPLQLSKILPL
ncbi:uncharacterized protein LOC117702778 [Arvicanthis niloticus]|uniref:uncharacterized protein LOC117702778 n=1 Tax=Arvicanthis niloticus TaxID=61156 RepID=UPI00403C2CD1